MHSLYEVIWQSPHLTNITKMQRCCVVVLACPFQWPQSSINNFCWRLQNRWPCQQALLQLSSTAASLTMYLCLQAASSAWGLGWTSNHRIALVALLAIITVLLMVGDLPRQRTVSQDCIAHAEMQRAAARAP